MWNLIPRPGTEPMLPALEVWSPNYWTSTEVPRICYLNLFFFNILFIYSTAPGLSWGTWDLLVVALELLAVTCGIQLPGCVFVRRHWFRLHASLPPLGEGAVSRVQRRRGLPGSSSQIADGSGPGGQCSGLRPEASDNEVE